MKTDSPLADLSRAAVRWGSDLDLVQGQGGNLSWKQDGLLHVKGSGTRLEDALERDIFAVCDLTRCLEAYAAGDEAGVRASMTRGPQGLRPSIETAMHAVLPGRCVFHCHSVDAIAATVDGTMEYARDAVQRLGARIVDYTQPGLKLARAIVDQGADAPVYILKNHGVILQGDSIEQVEDRLAAVRGAISRTPAFEIAKSRRVDQEEPEWSVYRDADMAALGRIANERPELRDETLYPDHAVILGHGIPKERDDARGWFIDQNGLVHIKDNMRATLEPMIEALLRIVARLDRDAPWRGLSAADVAALLNWDAEKERQAMARR